MVMGERIESRAGAPCHLAAKQSEGSVDASLFPGAPTLAAPRLRRGGMSAALQSPARVWINWGTRRFSDLERHSDDERIPGVLVFRVESLILYFNVEHIRDVFMEKFHAAPEPLTLVLCDLSNIPRVDLAEAEILKKLQRELGQVDRLKSVVDVLDELQLAPRRASISPAGLSPMASCS